MTVAVALRTPDGMLFGADNASVAGWDMYAHSAATAKLWTQGPFTFAHSGQTRFAQALRYEWEPPLGSGASFAELARMLSPSFRALAEQQGLWVKHADDKTPQTASTLLMAYDGGLYRLGGDFVILRIESDYGAVGGGEDCALGALYATAQVPPPPEWTATAWARQRVQWALEAAETHKMGIRGPYTFLWAAGAPVPAESTNGHGAP